MTVTTSFRYTDSTVPHRYQCYACGAHGCKLWREYNVIVSHNELRCCDCAAKAINKSIGDTDSLGFHDNGRGGTDQIGWHVPAVPTESGDTYWGYASVPLDGVNWWRNLPTRLTSLHDE